MSETKHAPGRVYVGIERPYYVAITSPHYYPIRGECVITRGQPTGGSDWPAISNEERAANARRLAACWNACEGMETAGVELVHVKTMLDMHGELEAQRNALLAACKSVDECWHILHTALKYTPQWAEDARTDAVDILNDLQDQVRGAIAKAEGKP